MRQRGFIPIIILLIVVLVGVVGYFVYIKGYFNQFLNTMEERTITTNPYPIATPSIIPTLTENWQTYINQDYKFLIKYPNNWTIRTCSNNGVLDEQGFMGCSGNKGENNLTSLNPNDLIFIEIFPIDQTASFELMVSKDIQSPSPTIASTQNNEKGPGVLSGIKSLPDVIIGGVVSKKVTATGPGNVTTIITTKDNNLIYRFSMDEIYWDKSEGDKIDEIYNNILTSFKFTQ